MSAAKNRKVKIRCTLEYEVEYPGTFDDEGVLFHRNEGSWCASNIIEELQSMDNEEFNCLCDKAVFEIVKESTK